MRNLRALALWGIGVFSAMALGACATELQEAASSAGPPDDLTSDLGSDTASTSTSTSTSTNVTTSSSHSVASTVSVTTGEANSTETSTTGRLPLGGTITSSATVSTTSGNTTGGATSATGTSGNTNGGNTNGGNTNGGNTTGGGGVGAVSEAAVNNTTGGGACVATPATAPVPLEPMDGWVDCSTNDIGIQGTFFTYEDGNGSSITSDFAGDEICVEGTAGQIVGGDNDTWGAGLGVNLNQADAEADVNTWNANAMGISGFRFTLSAMPAGTGLRLVYQNGGTDYCVEVTSAGAQTVLFEDTAEACWSGGGAAPSGTMMEAVKWQVTTNATSDHDFAFCISALTAIP